MLDSLGIFEVLLSNVEAAIDLAFDGLRRIGSCFGSQSLGLACLGEKGSRVASLMSLRCG